MPDEIRFLFGVFGGLALLIGIIIGATNGMIYAHDKMMAERGFKRAPVCARYESFWVGGGVTESPIKNVHAE